MFKTDRPLRLLCLSLLSVSLLFFNNAVANVAQPNQTPECKTEVFFQKTVVLIRAGHWDQAEADLGNLLNMQNQSCESATTRLKAEVHNARLLWKRGNLSTGEAALLKAKANAEQQSQNEIVAEISLELAEITFVRAMHMRSIPPAQAISAYEESITYALSADRPDIQSHSLGRLGIVYERTGDPEKGETFYKKALKIAQEASAQDQLHLPLTHIGSILLDRGETEAARSHFTDALAAAQNSSQPEQMVFAYMNFARHAERGENYSEKDAFIDLYKANELAHRLDHKIAVTISYLHLASVAGRGGESELARNYATSALLVAETYEFNSLKEIAEAILGNLTSR